jgi:hypothetical protein
MKKTKKIILSGLAAAALVTAGFSPALASPPRNSVTWAGPASPDRESCPMHDVLAMSDIQLNYVRIFIPDGTLYEAHGQIRFRLLCGIESGDVDLRLQRHLFLRKHDFEWTTQNADKINLAGRPRGYEFTLRVSAYCGGIANWRLRFFGSPGRADDGKIITPEILYFPSSEGKMFNCPDHT